MAVPSSQESCRRQKPSSEQTSPGVRDHPAAAVIVRTVSRPLFLRRALHSVSQQTSQDFVCVVVCNGGEVAVVREECERASLMCGG
jgi:hypothetical protein